MSQLVNREGNLFFNFSPIKKDEFGFLCDIYLHTELINISYENALESDRYISHQNLCHIKNELIKLDNIDIFQDEDEVFSIYPIDMFMMIDVFKASNEILWIELKMPTGIFTNEKIGGYFIAFNFWVYLKDFKNFIENFIEECYEL